MHAHTKTSAHPPTLSSAHQRRVVKSIRNMFIPKRGGKIGVYLSRKSCTLLRPQSARAFRQWPGSDRVRCCCSTLYIIRNTKTHPLGIGIVLRAENALPERSDYNNLTYDVDTREFQKFYFYGHPFRRATSSKRIHGTYAPWFAQNRRRALAIICNKSIKSINLAACIYGHHANRRAR